MLSRLIIPPGHRVAIELNPDTPLGVTITAYRGGDWLGETSCTPACLDDARKVQGLVDGLTSRLARRRRT